MTSLLRHKIEAAALKNGLRFLFGQKLPLDNIGVMKLNTQGFLQTLHFDGLTAIGGRGYRRGRWGRYRGHHWSASSRWVGTTVGCNHVQFFHLIHGGKGQRLRWRLLLRLLEAAITAVVWSFGRGWNTGCIVNVCCDENIWKIELFDFKVSVAIFGFFCWLF